MAIHTPAVRRAYRTSTLIWFLCIVPATLAVFGATLAISLMVIGGLAWLPGVIRDPGRWWESSRQGLDLPTVGLAALLGVMTFIPHTAGWVRGGAPHMLWMMASLVGLLTLMWRSSVVIQGAFWPGSAARRSRRRFHRLWLGLTAAGTGLVGALYAALMFPGVLPSPIEQLAVQLSGAVALIPPLALPFTGLIVLDVDATLAINRWSLPRSPETHDDTDEDEVFARWRGATPAQALQDQLDAIGARYGLTRTETPEGWALSGAHQDHALRLRIEQARLPPRVVIEANVPTLAARFPELWVRARHAAPDAPRLGDLIFDRTLSAGGAPDDAIRALLGERYDDVLCVLGGRDEAAIADGRIEVRIHWEDASAQDDLGGLEQQVEDVLRLTVLLEARAAEIMGGADRRRAPQPIQG
ncbi:MAG: hypothetical protein AAFV53_37360 [Myxococcota bacterium]